MGRGEKPACVMKRGRSCSPLFHTAKEDFFLSFSMLSPFCFVTDIWGIDLAHAKSEICEAAKRRIVTLLSFTWKRHWNRLNSSKVFSMALGPLLYLVTEKKGKTKYKASDAIFTANLHLLQFFREEKVVFSIFLPRMQENNAHQEDKMQPTTIQCKNSHSLTQVFGQCRRRRKNVC